MSEHTACPHCDPPPAPARLPEAAAPHPQGASPAAHVPTRLFFTPSPWHEVSRAAEQRLPHPLPAGDDPTGPCHAGTAEVTPAHTADTLTDVFAAAFAIPEPEFEPAPHTSPTRPGSSAASERLRHHRGRWMLALAATAALAVLVVAGWAAGRPGRAPRAEPVLVQPASLDGFSEIDTPATTVLLRSLAITMGSPTGTVVAGVYGTAGSPRLVLTEVHGHGVGMRPAQLAAALRTGNGPMVGAPEVTVAGGEAYVCGQSDMPGAPAAVVCAWSDADVVGFVDILNSTDVAGAIRVAAEARTIGER